ncbi:hypothetical protein F2Q69_00013542 [Brassica cretica]|uniref:Uncharacterized protein n=1 Tax=Brassica cretica TaxID=69181 RepID=A0A8S9QYJ2_BRACR|nr:hypothetical protein F2Q69_00013542 [Brassica cretica]
MRRRTRSSSPTETWPHEDLNSDQERPHIENTTDVNTLHNDPLMVELATGNCEVTSPHRHQQLG